jgi:hypothetical protein
MGCERFLKIKLEGQVDKAVTETLCAQEKRLFPEIILGGKIQDYRIASSGLQSANLRNETWNETLDR